MTAACLNDYAFHGKFHYDSAMQQQAAKHPKTQGMSGYVENVQTIQCKVG
jgi:hypothetical protein